jgi:2-oxoglutarate ferredoxin oxidoreductase subunit alpha
VLAGFETVIIPEMNLGQLCTMIRAKYLVDAVPFSKVKGRPFQIREIVGRLKSICGNKWPFVAPPPGQIEEG